MNRFIDRAGPNEVNRLYELCCDVQLKPPPWKNRGFLMSDYKANPSGMKKYINDCVSSEGALSLATFEDGLLPGWLLGYSKEAWYEGWASDIILNPAAELAKSKDYVVLEKIIVHSCFRRNGIGRELYERFVEFSKQINANYIFIEIVEAVLKGENLEDLELLDIKNTVSIDFFKAMGAKKVGESKVPYHYGGSYLGDNGFFTNGIYMVDLKNKE